MYNRENSKYRKIDKQRGSTISSFLFYTLYLDFNGSILFGTNFITFYFAILKNSQLLNKLYKK